MRAVRRWWSRLREFARAASVERDAADEIQSHIDHLTDEYVQKGLSPDDARRRARLEFGGAPELARDAIRDTRGLPWLEHTMMDVRLAWRSLLTTRGFTVTAVMTLGLGIGVTTAVFSLLDHVVLRPLPYPDDIHLVALWEADLSPRPSPQAASASLIYGSDDPGRMAVAAAAYENYRVKAEGFAGMAAYMRESATLTGTRTPEQVLGEIVTPGYFGVLGASPARGRLLVDADARSDAPAVAVISHRVWQQTLGGARDIVGRAVVLNGRPREIVGVMAPGFVPVSELGLVEHVSYWTTASFPPELLANFHDHQLNVVARLAPGVSVHQAQAGLTAVSDGLAVRHREKNPHIKAFIRPLADDVVRRVSRSLTVIMLMVAAILVLACVNIANLLIVRGAGKRREIAIRYALGASRRRVLAEMLTESLVLSSMACVLGMVLAVWLKNALVALAPQNLPRLHDVSLDARVLLFSIAVALATGVLFGAMPAWQARRTRPTDAMASGGRVVAGRWVTQWRHALLVFEIAVSLILLIGAGLMMKSLLSLGAVELGFRTEGVVAMNVTLPEQRYPTGDRRVEFFQRLEDRLRGVPGVVDVGFANRLPMRGAWESGIEIDGVAESRQDAGPVPFNPTTSVAIQAVSPGYFATLDIRLLSGRLLTASDVTTSEPVAVVSEAFAARKLNGADPRGRRIRRGPKMPWITIVGVVSDIRRDGQRAAVDPQVFLPAAQTQLYPTRLADIAVRVQGDDDTSVRAAMREAVAAIDPEQPIGNIRSLEEVVAGGARDQRFQATLVGAFAVLALLLSAIGVHGVVSYLVTQRTAEIGVRMALGADRRAIMTWLLRGAFWRVAAGAAAGLGAAALLSRYVASLLFEVQPFDPATYAAGAGVLVAIALSAAALAARRATHVDPASVLRA
jgi:putative ABC transport system permease protein